MKNENIVKLRFFFDNDIDILISEIWLTVDKSWNKWDRSLGNIWSIYKNNWFEISSWLSKNIDIDRHIYELFNKINNSIITIIKDKRLIKIELSIFIYLYDTSNWFHIDRKYIEILNSIWAEIDVDIYKMK